MADTELSTGSTTIADLLLRAAGRYSDRTFVRAKVGDAWVDTTFAEVGTIVSELARGLIAVSYTHLTLPTNREV